MPPEKPFRYSKEPKTFLSTLRSIKVPKGVTESYFEVSEDMINVLPKTKKQLEE